ncbi:glutamate--tRNA ligase [Candidatus Parcubacteria bacterium]|nr:glutamate--tRNA ligase [Candidatus Parcubacteria bacterium]
MPEQKQVRVRFAPSPTGSFHIGNARTALFNYLFARHEDGTFVLRIEDTDAERSSGEFEAEILAGLTWLGLHWDEGPDSGGPYAPYRQSERRTSYEEYARRLLAKGQAYFCYCTEEELEAQKQDLASRGESPRYSGRCRNLTEAERAKFQREGRSAVLRFQVPEREVSFKDLIRGKISFDMALVGDFSIAKVALNRPTALQSGGQATRATESLEFSPLYNFSVVVDDFEMRISHVIRGEDHISNTPKQLLLQEALGFSCPEYAHLPLILGPDRSKLSSRHGATSLKAYREDGFLAGAMLNILAFLGWNPGGTREMLSLEELIKEFSLARVHKAGAVFNANRLEWLNAQYLRALAPEALLECAVPFLVSAGLLQPADGGYRIVKTGEQMSDSYLQAVLRLEQGRMKKLSEIAALTEFFFVDVPDYDANLLPWKGRGKEDTREALEAVGAVIEAVPAEDFTVGRLSEGLLAVAAERGDRGIVLWPLRVALTGREASPDPIEIAAILGKDKTAKRLQAAITKLRD